ncbi:hypothetical protein QOT17_016369 [Balamuthia mandrillaris]
MALFSGLQFEAGSSVTFCSPAQHFVSLEEFTQIDQQWLSTSSSALYLTTFAFCDVVLNEPFLPGDRNSCQTLTEENFARFQVPPLGAGFRYLGPGTEKATQEATKGDGGTSRQQAISQQTGRGEQEHRTKKE